MFCAGIDVGSLTAEAVIVDDRQLVAAARLNVLPHPVDSAKQALAGALAEAGLAQTELCHTVSTGYGREQVQAAGLAQENISEISCHGFGAYRLCPAVRTIIDIGGQDAKVIKLNAAGELDNFVMNDKCAAGTGHFLELMCRALNVTLDELGPLALRARRPVQMSNRCSIFMETEVLHYLQRGVAREDVAAGVNRAMAERVLALARRVRPEPSVMLTGGVAKNIAVKTALEGMLKMRMAPPDIDPQLIGAFGAACLARRRGGTP